MSYCLLHTEGLHLLGKWVLLPGLWGRIEMWALEGEVLYQVLVGSIL